MKRCTFCCVKLSLAYESKFFFLIKDSFAQPHVNERLPHIHEKRFAAAYSGVMSCYRNFVHFNENLFMSWKSNFSV